MIAIAALRDHPRNSNRHGDRQLEVLATRWRALGWYKNVVVAEWEGTTTLLAGHGIVAGARAAGATEAPCHVREIDPLSPEALDILEGDNTVADLAEPDLHERLRNLVELDAAGRLGNVGYDDGALKELLGNLEEHAFDVEAEDHAITKDLVEHKWFVGFVLEQEDKDALGHIIDDEQLSGEKPHQTLTRIIRRKVLNRQ